MAAAQRAARNPGAASRGPMRPGRPSLSWRRRHRRPGPSTPTTPRRQQAVERPCRPRRRVQLGRRRPPLVRELLARLGQRRRQPLLVGCQPLVHASRLRHTSSAVSSSALASTGGRHQRRDQPRFPHLCGSSLNASVRRRLRWSPSCFCLHSARRRSASQQPPWFGIQAAYRLRPVICTKCRQPHVALLVESPRASWQEQRPASIWVRHPFPQP